MKYVVLLSTVIVESVITCRELSRVVAVGSSLTLSCSTDSAKEMCWEYYPNHASIPRTIYTGRHVNRQYRNTHRVAFSGGRSTLTLLIAQLQDAGRYQCRECSTVHSADIELIVLSK